MTRCMYPSSDMKVGIYLLYILHSTTVHLLQTSCRLPRGWPVGAKRELSELPAMNSRRSDTFQENHSA